jgi:hypothetical protein
MRGLTGSGSADEAKTGKGRLCGVVTGCTGTGSSGEDTIGEDTMDISIVVFIIRIKKIIPNARLVNSSSIL